MPRISATASGTRKAAGSAKPPPKPPAPPAPLMGRATPMTVTRPLQQFALPTSVLQRLVQDHMDQKAALAVRSPAGTASSPPHVACGVGCAQSVCTVGAMTPICNSPPNLHRSHCHLFPRETGCVLKVGVSADSIQGKCSESELTYTRTALATLTLTILDTPKSQMESNVRRQ